MHHRRDFLSRAMAVPVPVLLSFLPDCSLPSAAQTLVCSALLWCGAPGLGVLAWHGLSSSKCFHWLAGLPADLRVLISHFAASLDWRRHGGEEILNNKQDQDDCWALHPCKVASRAFAICVYPPCHSRLPVQPTARKEIWCILRGPTEWEWERMIPNSRECVLLSPLLG